MKEGFYRHPLLGEIQVFLRDGQWVYGIDGIDVIPLDKIDAARLKPLERRSPSEGEHPDRVL